MKVVTGLLAAVLLLCGVGASHAVVRISDDRGGRIGTYVDKYQGLKGSGETVVIDWGLAKDLRAGDSLLEAPSSSVPAAAHADLTRTGEFMGTLPFMPPEQIEGGDVDCRGGSRVARPAIGGRA